MDRRTGQQRDRVLVEPSRPATAKRVCQPKRRAPHSSPAARLAASSDRPGAQTDQSQVPAFPRMRALAARRRCTDPQFRFQRSEVFRLPAAEPRMSPSSGMASGRPAAPSRPGVGGRRRPAARIPLNPPSVGVDHVLLFERSGPRDRGPTPTIQCTLLDSARRSTVGCQPALLRARSKRGAVISGRRRVSSAWRSSRKRDTPERGGRGSRGAKGTKHADNPLPDGLVRTGWLTRDSC